MYTGYAQQNIHVVQKLIPYKETIDLAKKLKYKSTNSISNSTGLEHDIVAIHNSE